MSRGYGAFHGLVAQQLRRIEHAAAELPDREIRGAAWTVATQVHDKGFDFSAAADDALLAPRDEDTNQRAEHMRNARNATDLLVRHLRQAETALLPEDVGLLVALLRTRLSDLPLTG